MTYKFSYDKVFTSKSLVGPAIETRMTEPMSAHVLALVMADMKRLMELRKKHKAAGDTASAEFALKKFQGLLSVSLQITHERKSIGWDPYGFEDGEADLKLLTSEAEK